MRQIELRTASHDFVAVVEIPPFPDAGLPEVVIWGSRTFSRVPDVQHLDRVVYAEVFACVALTPSPGLPVT